MAVREEGERLLLGGHRGGLLMGRMISGGKTRRETEAVRAHHAAYVSSEFFKIMSNENS